MKTKRQIFHKDELQSIDAFLENYEKQLYCFLRLYFECELIVRRIIKSNLKDVSQNDISELNLSEIRKALGTVGIAFEQKKLNMVFAKYKSANEHSYRHLRNMIVHKLQKKAIYEVVRRSETMTSDMVSFVELFK